jgi:hypothetical protein
MLKYIRTLIRRTIIIKKSVNLLKLALCLCLALTVYILLYKRLNNINSRSLTTVPNEPEIEFQKQPSITIDNFISNNHLKIESEVNSLVLVLCDSIEQCKSSSMKEILIHLDSLRIKYHLQSFKLSKTGKLRLSGLNLYSKTNQKLKGHYGLVIIESLDLIEKLDYEHKQYLNHYCTRFRVGVIFLFTKAYANISKSIRFGSVSISLKQVKLSNIECYLNEFEYSKEFFKITKSSHARRNLDLLSSSIDVGVDYYSFNSSNDQMEPLIVCNQMFNVIAKTKTNVSSLIPRLVVFGIDLNIFEISSALLLDLLAFASFDRLSSSVKRYIQIDIDDIFVGSSGKRMTPADVNELINFQENILNTLYFNSSNEKFKFNLGFSGYYFKSGNFIENQADNLLIGNFSLILKENSLYISFC